MQDAQFKCYFGNYIEVDASNCLQAQLPKMSQVMKKPSKIIFKKLKIK